MKRASKSAISIIGGADDPKCIFIAGKSKKQPLKIRIRNVIYRYKRKRVGKKIAANPHTFAEVVEYARLNYELIEIVPSGREYKEAYKSLKESLILQHKSEVLGEMKDFHLYKIRIDDGFLEIRIDFIWNIFNISYSGDKKAVKKFKKISKELYLYYGVSKEDIREKTKRYSSLIAILSS